MRKMCQNTSEAWMWLTPMPKRTVSRQTDSYIWFDFLAWSFFAAWITKYKMYTIGCAHYYTVVLMTTDIARDRSKKGLFSLLILCLQKSHGIVGTMKSSLLHACMHAPCLPSFLPSFLPVFLFQSQNICLIWYQEGWVEKGLQRTY